MYEPKKHNRQLLSLSGINTNKTKEYYFDEI